VLKNRNLFFLLFLIFEITQAQYPTLRERVTNLPNFDKKTIHYGYYLGFNSYDFKFEYIENYYSELGFKDIAVSNKTGFNVGIVTDLRINEFFNLRLEPGFYYSQRELMYPEFTEFTKESDRIREIKSNYIHVPLILKVSTRRINNFRPFLLFGGSVDFNLSSNRKKTDDNFGNIFRTVSNHLNYELGLGFDFYLFYFKFSPSIRGVFSFENEIIPDASPNSPWTSRISGMFTRGFVINFTFE